MGNKATTQNFYDDIRVNYSELHQHSELYKIVNTSGSGKLVEMMRETLKSNNPDFRKVDEYIKTELAHFFYNNGEGKNIPIEQLVAIRAPGLKDKFIQNPTAVNLTKIAEKTRASYTKYTCFDVTKRGAFGETLLHLLFINPTYAHMALAKRIIRFYPKCINDVYIGSEYYGETALHLAIVNEDTNMVKFLLENGANVNQRCCGRFFAPNDQKNERKESFTNEHPTVCTKTNYEGWCYYGEYPLSFAAVLNQEEIFHYLLSKGADPNRQDSNGNTVLHMLVITENLPMIKTVLEYNSTFPDIKIKCDIKNRQSLTPLTLAAYLGKIEIYQCILVNLRQVHYVYADVECASYPMDTIDTVLDDGRIDRNSVLYFAVFGNTKNHLKMLDGVLLALLYKKWNNYVKFRFFSELFFFTLFFTLCVLALILKREYWNKVLINQDSWNLTQANQSNSSSSNMTICLHNITDEIKILGVPQNSSHSYVHITPECPCFYRDLKYAELTALFTIRIVTEIIICFYSLIYIMITANEVYVQHWKLFLHNLVTNPTKIFFYVSIACIICVFAARILCSHTFEDYSSVMGIICLMFYFLYFGRGFRRICIFVNTFHIILKQDFYKFFAIYTIFVLGFSQSFSIIYDFGQFSPEAETLYFNGIFNSIIDTFNLSFKEIEGNYVALNRSPYKLIGMLMFFVYLILVTVILVYLFIAMMINTYDIQHKMTNEWLRLWARQVLTIEININSQERLKHRNKYLEMSKDLKEKVLTISWKQTEDERKESHRPREIVTFLKKIFERKE